MAQVRMELGRDAIILHSHKVKRRGLRGLFSRPMIEVTAATDDSPGQRSGGATAEPAGFGAAAAAQPLVQAPEPQVINGDLAALAGQMAEMKALLSQAVWSQPGGFGAIPPAGQDLYAQMTTSGLQPELAQKVVSEALDAAGPDPTAEALTAAARTALADLIGRGQPVTAGRRQVIALVGPTGVGKTTTLAKLAARFALGEGRRVALVTADTYRIAAVEQLRTYGDIIGIPVDVIFTAQELRQALARHRECDLVLIDTAGRSHKNAMQMSELRSLLEAAQPDETHLVLSLTTNFTDAVTIMERFGMTNYNRLLLTKLDETSHPGQIVNFAHAAGRPLSYVANGQSVPDDLEAADADKLAGLILEE